MQAGVVADAVQGQTGLSLLALDQDRSLAEDPKQVGVEAPFDDDPHSVGRALRVLLGQLKVGKLGEIPSEAAEAAAVVQVSKPS